MTTYYEELMELWKAGKFFDPIRYFSRWMSEGLVSEEEIESFNKNLSKFWEIVEVECEENPEVMFTLYEMLRNARCWDNQTLCRKPKISQKALEDIKNHHKPKSEGLGLKMLYELFPQMAV
ncbi:MAG TPA: hypothetical protein VLW47_12895 [Thermodesulfobacteriota bacterium]|nr:hypothetical protein [Thermodesulfobacteriota bacterium]